jgi:hypothetical protein
MPLELSSAKPDFRRDDREYLRNCIAGETGLAPVLALIGANQLMNRHVLFRADQATKHLLGRFFLELGSLFDMYALFDLALENLCEIAIS